MSALPELGNETNRGYEANLKSEAPRKKSRAEIRDILKRNLDNYRGQEHYADYLLDLAVHLLEFEYDWRESPALPPERIAQRMEVPAHLPPSARVVSEVKPLEAEKPFAERMPFTQPQAKPAPFSLSGTLPSASLPAASMGDAPKPFRRLKKSEILQTPPEAPTPDSVPQPPAARATSSLPDPSQPAMAQTTAVNTAPAPSTLVLQHLSAAQQILEAQQDKPAAKAAAPEAGADDAAIPAARQKSVSRKLHTRDTRMDGPPCRHCGEPMGRSAICPACRNVN